MMSSNSLKKPRSRRTPGFFGDGLQPSYDCPHRRSLKDIQHVREDRDLTIRHDHVHVRRWSKVVAASVPALVHAFWVRQSK